MKTPSTRTTSTSKKVEIDRKRKLHSIAEQSHHQLQSILQHAPAATAVLEGPEHTYILANKVYQKLFNRQEKDFLGKSIHEVFPELAGSGAFELVDHVFATGESFDAPEYTLLVDAHNDGRLRQNFYHFSMEPLKNDLDEIYAVIATIYDITQQVESRRKIEDSEKLKAFMLKLNDALRLLSAPQQIKIKAMQILGEHLNVSRCYYAEIIGDGKYCVIDNSFSSGLDAIDGTYRLEDFGKANVAMLERGEVIVTADVAKDTSVTQEERNRNLEMQIQAYVSVPLVKDSKLICLLGVNQSVVRQWTPLDIACVQEAAERTWAAVERAKANEALSTSEEKFRTLFDSMDQGFTLCELIRNKEGKAIDLCILEVNPTYEQQTGVKKETVLGRPLLQVFPTYDSGVEIYASMVDNQRPVVYEQYFEVTDRWFAIKAYPVKGDRFAVLFSDITERKKADEKTIQSEKEIREIRDQLELSIKAGKIGLWFWDVKKDILTWSTEQKKMYGFSASEVITSAAQFNALIVPEDLNRIQVDQSGGDQVEHEYNFRIIRKNDGELRWIQSRARNTLDSQGALQSISGVNIDVTEQVLALNEIKESENRFRTMADASPVLIWTLGANGLPSYYNRTFLDFIGASKGADIADWKQIVHPADFQFTFDTINTAIAERSTYSLECRLLRGDGQWRWVLAQGNPHIGTNNEFLGFVGSSVDITEGKQLEEKRQESEKELREIGERLELSIRAGKIGAWFWDVKKDILTWSNEQKEMYGFSASEEITSAAQFNALILPEDQNRIQVDQSSSKKVEHEYDFRINRKNDGELRWIRSRARNTYDQQGALQFISGVNIDVTEQVLALNRIKESEEALAQQKQLLESVTENTDLALFLMDEKQCCIYMNHAAEQMTGFTLSELKGKQLHDHIHHSHPDGSPFPLAECPIDQAFPSEAKMKGEEVFVHKDGSFYTVAFIASPITHNGIAIGTVIEVRETAEDKRKEQQLKASEHRFRTLAETLPQMVWVMDGDGTMEYGSKHWKEYSGFDDVMEAWNYMVHPDERERLTAYWGHVLAQGKGYHHEVRLKNKEGVYRWFNSVGKPLLDADEKVSKWMGSLNDIHEQKNVEDNLEKEVASRTKELEHKNTDLQNMNKELEAFTHISSHDLQEPLRKIRTFAGRIMATEKDNLSETGNGYLLRMNNEAERMSVLIQDLLSFSSLMNVEMKFEITDLSKIIDELKADFEDAISEVHAIIITRDLCEVKIIPFQFRQLMHNLIANALKFARPDVPPIIIIKSEIRSAMNSPFGDRGACHISVSDNGIGFEQKFSEKIFEVFQRLHNKEDYAGTGIGLAIVKKIVDIHKGIITAEGEPGKGATFNIYLPLE